MENHSGPQCVRMKRVNMKVYAEYIKFCLASPLVVFVHLSVCLTDDSYRRHKPKQINKPYKNLWSDQQKKLKNVYIRKCKYYVSTERYMDDDDDELYGGDILR